MITRPSKKYLTRMYGGDWRTPLVRIDKLGRERLDEYPFSWSAVDRIKQRKRKSR